MSEDNKVIKLSNKTSVRKLIDYFTTRVEKDKGQPIEMVAMGSAIHKLVNTVEVITHLFPGLYYKFEFATVVRKFTNAENELVDQRQTPVLKTFLAFEESKADLTAYVKPLPEELYTKLNKKMVERKEAKRKVLEEIQSNQRGKTSAVSFRKREDRRPRYGKSERVYRETRSFNGRQTGQRGNFYWQSENWKKQQHA